MFDFPTSPTTGQVYTSGGAAFQWDGEKWMGGSPATAQTEQWFTLDGLTQLDITVPSWAKSVQLTGSIYTPNATAVNVVLYLSTDGTTFHQGASDYAYMGPWHNEITPFYNTVGLTSAAYFPITYVATGQANPNVPIYFTTDITLSRKLHAIRNYTKQFADTGNQYALTNWYYGYLLAASAGQRVQKIRIVPGFTPVADSWVKVQWLGDRAQLPQGSAIPDCPNDGAEYVRVGGLWRKKSQSFVLDGLSSQIITVPTGARLMRLDGTATPPTTTPTAMCFRVSFDGTNFMQAAADYTSTGFIHYSASAPTAVSALSGSAAQGYLTYNGVNAALSHVFRGTLGLIRAASGGMLRWDYHGTGTYYGSSQWSTHVNRMEVMETNAAGNLTLKAVQILSVPAIALGAPSVVDVEWVY